ncbi:YbaN family protein [Octadecabacter sp. CECT 8868]|uniref:YbaN family protein n=1 Tax=Octadecabacter algicola TaxID=2909342 RepID=UPI001F2FE878|nr:YbaN family protein [Octadecabacter algicola]MCF2904677.1 YbaN family protein [Octadecabacter algicola]
MRIIQIQILSNTLGRAIWFVVGALALLLGVIGIVLPILPTTPFVILAAFAFAKGSPTIAKFLENHTIFGPIIAEWRAHGAIAKRYKVFAHLMMLAGLLLTVVLKIAPIILAIQVICMACASLYILTRPSDGGA